MQKIYLIRHCQATGQESMAPLTAKGQKDAHKLAMFLQNAKIEAILSSPFERAIKTAYPLSKVLNLPIVTDKRLQERILSSQNLSDWMEQLKLTFEDLSVKYEGGESSKEAIERAKSALEDILATEARTAAVVTHGNLLSLILHYYNNTYGFNTWKAFTNPDIYLLTYENNEVKIDRVWE